MKKLLALVLGLVVAFSTMMFTACGSTIFDGDYSEATKEDLTTFAAEVDAVEGGNDLDYSLGFKMSFKTERDMYGSKEKTQIDAKTAFVENDLQMEATMLIDNTYVIDENTTENFKIEGSSYYKGGFAYANVAMTENGETESVKQKIEVPMDNFIGEYTGEMETNLSELIEGLAMYEEMQVQGLKLYMDKGEENTKIKVVIPEQTLTVDGMETSMEMEIVLVYNSSKKLIAVRNFMKTSATYVNPVTNESSEMIVNFDITVEPYDGAIEFPADLDTYTAM
ncbi:MAG: hypothetical protein IJY57_01855 [Clostridia bacterium]|nr:hypothetical protein [Clostridia bacterium]